MLPLRYEDGEHIKDPKPDERDLKEALARHLLNRQVVNETTILDVCIAYLNHAKVHGAEKTHFDRADTLFDFCFGLPPEFRNKDGSSPKKLTADQKKDMAKKRFHDGYGRFPVRELTWAHIDE